MLGKSTSLLRYKEGHVEILRRRMKLTASPECTPSPSSLDFSVYALDPSPRPRPTQPFAPSTDEMAYTGKGFLSWALSEPANGKTLVKGRLVKEYDFDTSRFSHSEGEGGLEGLMRAGGGGDGRGWGLEVVLSLKMVNPAGKGEFSGRMEFERMLYNPTSTVVGASGSVLVTNPNMTTNPRSTASTSNTNSPRIARANILPPPPPTRPIATSSPAHRASSTGPMHGPAPGNKANGGPTAQRIVRPPPPQPSSSRSSLPPSSIPMAPTSSQSQPQPPSRGPSRPSSSATVVDDTGRTPTGTNAKPQANGVGVGVGMGKPPSAGPSKQQPQQQQHITPPKSSSKPTSTTSSRNRNREVTPPPLPRPRSPPPTTPHRRALRDLLQADGKMSPSLAKDLVNNPSLLALLKSIPTTKSDTNTNANANGSDTKGKGKGKETKPDLNPGSSRSARDGTPTPTAPKAKVESIPGGCFNCGTLETTLWRVKAYPDGSKKKVCDGSFPFMLHIDKY
jgi:hypothetical protein